MQNSGRIFRYGSPSKMDSAPKGTECYVAQVNKPGIFDIYQQCSSDQEDPNWVFIKTITEEEIKSV